jgi:hypothetical protein
MQDSGHFVDFFHSDDELTTTTANFLHEGFVNGCSCIAVLTQQHFAAVQELLAAHGLDAQRLIDDYRFVAVDASEALETLSSDDRLDLCGFYGKFSELIRLLSAGGREVRIIGEVAGLLAERGRMDTVFRVEELCNELSREHAFRMYCLYRENLFAEPLNNRDRRRICAAHSGSLRAA